MARVLTWHVHGNYLLYLCEARHEFLVPVLPGRPHGYGGRSGSFPWPDNLVEVDGSRLHETDCDVVLYQSPGPWQERHALLGANAALPQVYLEHDPPRESPYDTPHPVDDPDTLVVHVTPFNRLMWDTRVDTAVVEHGVRVPARARYTGERERGLVIVNDLATRGRRLGLDVFLEARERVPLDLVGMGSEALGGLGEIPPPELPAFAAQYRFLFNPIRWTSLGLAVLEAMHVGLPVVGLATTEMAPAVVNGVSGHVDTDVDALVRTMETLLADPDEARRLGRGARRLAQERYSIGRFADDWTSLLDGCALGSSSARERSPSDQRRAIASKSAR
jgi:glycosyltransferase involved in cell wall biosynthesis